MEEIIEEIWKDIEGYEGLYQASDLGRIRSLDKFQDMGTFKRLRKGAILSGGKDKDGYKVILLYKDNKRIHYKVHRLILITFVDKSDLQVDHINNIKDDNRLINLRYCTSRENNTYRAAFNPNKTSKYVGVKTTSRNKNKWEANIHINGKYTYLGIFDTEEEASLKYQEVLKTI